MKCFLMLKLVALKKLIGGGWFGGRMNPCIHMAESLHCSCETIVTLLIGYIPIKNVFGVKLN